jgi:hypothetical protein
MDRACSCLDLKVLTFAYGSRALPEAFGGRRIDDPELRTGDSGALAVLACDDASL